MGFLRILLLLRIYSATDWIGVVTIGVNEDHADVLLHPKMVR